MHETAILDVLKRYPERYRASGFGPPPRGPGFSDAVVLQLETPAGLYCLRGWPAETTNPERVRGLHRFVAHLCKEGVDLVPVPLPASDGRTLVCGDGRWWQIEPWMPGRADYWLRPNHDRLTAALAALARIHLAAATFAAVGQETEWFSSDASSTAPAVVERIALLGNWTRDRVTQLRAGAARVSEPALRSVAAAIIRDFERCQPLIAHELQLAHSTRVPVQPCLRDVWHDHVLFEENAVVGIVDPSAARADTVAADISRLLGSLIGDDRTAWDCGLAAYETVRPLSPEEKILSGVLDRSGVVLSGMTWLARRFLDGRVFAQPERVIERLERIAARLRSIALAAT